MRTLIRLVVPIAVALACVQAAGATSPKLAAKRAQAARVLKQINAIDERLSVVAEAYDGARVRLDALRKRLQVERKSLAVARAQNTQAQLDEARLLVSLYVTERPSSIEVLLGAKNFSDLLSLSHAEAAINRQVAAVADNASRAQIRLRQRVQALQTVRAAAAATVRQLGQKRAEIERGLAQRRKLLSSVQVQITRIQAQERARQERLAAQARARLAAAADAARQKAAAEAARQKAAAEAAARARLAQEAKRRAATAAAAAAAASAAPQTTPPPVAVPADPAPAPPPTPAAIPPGQLPAGHPQAAQIVLQYIGVPYRWGGATPSGFDCSGLVSYVFAQLGIALPHYAADQYGYGVPIPIALLQPGDLVFFSDLGHVGIYIGNGQYVDAPDTGSFVRIDNLNDAWSATAYVGARRI